MAWILTHPASRDSDEYRIVVSDCGRTPVFRDAYEALACGQSNRITRPEPVEIPESHVRRLESPIRLHDGLTYDTAARESLAANGRKT